MDLKCKAARMQKNPPANEEHTGDMGSIPELGRSPGVGKSNILQILLWKIPWTEELCELQPLGGKELNTTER